MSTSPLASLDGIVYGPLYLAAVLSTAFYGVTCMQTFFYYVHYPNDSWRMKFFVAVLWALDTIHEALTVAGVYKYIITGLVNPWTMLVEIPELDLQMISQVLVALPTQAFLVYRIYVLSEKNIIAPLLWVIPAIYQIVATIIYEAKSFYTVNGSIQVVGVVTIDGHFFSSIATSSLSVAAGVDVLIAVAMTFLLLRKRTTTGFASTANILERLAMFAVNTGFWTAAFAVASAITMHAIMSNLYAVFFIPLSSLYCNTLLANLNARTYIRGEATTYNVSGDRVMVRSPMSSGTKVEKQSNNFDPSIHLDIRKTTESVTFVDVDRSTHSKNMV